jgi:PAS domain S-box-containing protein
VRPDPKKRAIALVSPALKNVAPSNSRGPLVSVVLVGDNSVGLASIREALSQSGFSTIVDVDRAGAVEAIRRAVPDLVIIDSRSNQAAAAALCRTIRLDPITSNAPVFILVDSSDDLEFLDRAIEAGADDFFQAHSPAILLKKRAENLIKARKQKREAEARYLTLVELIPALVYVAEPNPPYSPIYVSSNIDSLGYSLQDWYLPDHWVNILHHEDRNRVLAETARARSQGVINDYEYRMIAKDGSVRWFHDLGRFINQPDGKPILWQGFIIDITERKRTEEALIEGQERFRTLVETAGSVILSLSPDNVIRECNREAERVFGCNREEVIGRNYLDLGPSPEVRERIALDLEKVLAGESTRDFEYPIESRDGSTTLLLWKVTRHLDWQGNPTEMIAIGQDITERKRSEDALRASEERYRDLFENAIDLVYTRDLEGNFTSVNKAAELLTGYTREELLRSNFSDALSADHTGVIDWANRKVLAGEPIPPHEIEIFAKDGRKLALEVNNRPVYQDGKPVGLQGIARDVTERKRFQIQLAQTEKLSALGQLVSGVAHELNNPLTSVIGYTQLLLRSPLSPEIAQKLYIISEEGERVRKIVQNLLSFARQHNPSRTEVDVNQLLSRTLDLRAYEMGVNNVSVVMRLSELPKIYADEHQLQQVFLNIVINAEQALESTGRGGKLTVSTKKKVSNGLESVVISISDDGPGVAPENLSKLFDPFFTTKPVGTGTGLGLSVSYGIIQEHKGTIRVDSTLGSGTSFIIELPVQKSGRAAGEAS